MMTTMMMMTVVMMIIADYMPIMHIGFISDIMPHAEPEYKL